MDTNVLVSALRSREGASFEIFRRLRFGEWTAVLSNHLLFEYEEVLKRQSSELALSLEDVDELLNAICARADEFLLSHTWRPILRDPTMNHWSNLQLSPMRFGSSATMCATCGPRKDWELNSCVPASVLTN